MAARKFVSIEFRKASPAIGSFPHLPHCAVYCAVVMVQIIFIWFCFQHQATCPPGRTRHKVGLFFFVGTHAIAHHRLDQRHAHQRHNQRKG